MSISAEKFGTMPSGEEVYLYTVDSGEGLRAEFLSLGCIIRSLVVTDDNGRETDVALGRETLEEYVNGVGNFGATVGRVANRIRGGQFTIGDTTYNGEPNQKGHLLHSGWANFALRVFRASYDGEDSSSISFEIDSPDGENGFPGDLNAVVTFTLSGRELAIHYEAVANKDTILNFTNHSYFNLNGHESGNVLEHILRINADFYTPLDPTLIPTGEIIKVQGTPYDFTAPKKVGTDIASEHEQMQISGGYDTNFVLRSRGMREAAYLKGDKTGMVMRTYTDKPGLQIYTPGFLKGDKAFKGGAYYDKYQGICLETQHFPNAIEFGHFPSPIVRCGEKYDSQTIYSFDFE